MTKEQIAEKWNRAMKEAIQWFHERSDEWYAARLIARFLLIKERDEHGDSGLSVNEDGTLQVKIKGEQGFFITIDDALAAFELMHLNSYTFPVREGGLYGIFAERLAEKFSLDVVRQHNSVATVHFFRYALSRPAAVASLDQDFDSPDDLRAVIGFGMDVEELEHTKKLIVPTDEDELSADGEITLH